MNFAFAGTPDFAASVLSDLVALGRRPSLVISQPDRPQGRGRRAAAPPTVLQADRLGLQWMQTEDISSLLVAERLRGLRASALVVAAFGQLLRRPLLDSVLCLNVHASLLPLYRGAAPIERALAAGESLTGVSIMRMTEGIDEGPWALQTSVSLSLYDDAGSVGRTLALLGARGIDQVLRALTDGTVRWTGQRGAGSYAQKLGPRDCALDTNRGAKAVHDQVRSLSPSIGARATSGELAFKVWRTWPYGEPGLDAVPFLAEGVAGVPGEVRAASGRLFVGCAEGVVEVLMIQPAGKREMTASAFLRGYGARLGRLVEQADDVCRPRCGDQ